MIAVTTKVSYLVRKVPCPTFDNFPSPLPFLSVLPPSLTLLALRWHGCPVLPLLQPYPRPLERILNLVHLLRRRALHAPEMRGERREAMSGSLLVMYKGVIILLPSLRSSLLQTLFPPYLSNASTAFLLLSILGAMAMRLTP